VDTEPEPPLPEWLWPESPMPWGRFGGVDSGCILLRRLKLSDRFRPTLEVEGLDMVAVKSYLEDDSGSSWRSYLKCRQSQTGNG